MARFRALGWWVASAAVLAAWDDDIDEAMELISAGLHIASSLRHEPMLIVQFVRVNICGNAINAMYEVLDEGYPPGEQVPMIILELDKLRDRTSLARALQAERCFLLALDRLAAKALAKPFRLLDQLTYLDFSAEVTDLAGLPAYESRDALKELTDRVNRTSKLKVSARTLIPALVRALGVQDMLVAQCDIAEMAMYLKQYKKNTAAYPERLDAIVPDYIQELPVDPFTGGAYVYRKESEGFVLYSVSVNLVDDGGKPDVREGDIVWRSSR
jgi:hypothetical protein